MEERDFISKTQRKKEMAGLQKVGAELVGLPAETLARIRLPERLREAVEDARRITAHEGRRRQIQYIGRLMREVDAAPIVEQLAAIKAPTKRQTALFHVAEQWRDALVAAPESVERFAAEFPEADAQRIRALADEAREEKRTSRPPKRFRELFHALSAIVQEHGRRET